MGSEDIVGPFSDLASKYIEEKRVKEIIFSKGTYHIQVMDKKTQDPHWAFIQLDPHQKIKDFFCSCQENSFTNCEHLAAAFLKIYGQKSSPLHMRYEASFWKHIFWAFFERFGSEKESLIKKENTYFLKSGSHLFFSLKAKTEFSKKTFQEFIDLKEKETEETSLKFSNLPKSELDLWRQGHPSKSFKFELSFWSDLAKWMLIQQDSGHSYTVKIKPLNAPPKEITISFNDFEVYFKLSLESLIAIIPYLNTLKTPLKVHESIHPQIEKILYHPEEKSLAIFPKKKKPKKADKEEGIDVGSWVFKPNIGFYLKGAHKEDLKEHKILSHKIDEELEKNTHFFKTHLKNTSLEIKPISPKYHIYFDSKWALNINLYLFQEGDLTLPQSVFFGRWTFLQERGFFRLKESPFHQQSIYIPKDQVSSFIHQYRSWLNTQKGFEVHLATIQTKLSYHLSSTRQLTFSSNLGSNSEKSFDFGDWVYVEDQGFYSKARYSSPIGHGLKINKNEIAKFIQLHKDDLEQIPSFFNPKNPIKKTTIALNVDYEMQEIILEPQYHFQKEYQNKEVLFFDNYSYVHGEGFREIDKSLLLPKGFRKKVKILPHEQASFLAFEFKKLKPFISHVDQTLTVPQNLSLKLIGSSCSHFQMEYQSQLGAVNILDLLQAIRFNRPYYFSKAGLIHLSHPRFSWLHELPQENVFDNGIFLTTLDLIRVEAVDKAFSKKEDNSSFLKEIYKDVSLKPPKLKGFNTKLRPYQEIGLNWLFRLYAYNLSGLLCDDMGLGKTLQSMALIAACKNEPKQAKGNSRAAKKKFLIVCPTSVIYHWQDKLKEFYPSLNILTFYGLHRSLNRFQQRFDVLLTSYGILRIDQKQITKFDFTIVIYDEIQVAKNHRSLTYKALLNVKSKMKLGLTGTPIENNLRELKALLDLVIPRYMPSEVQYRDFFINPIEKDQDAEKIKVLKKMVEPFILRRKKEDVLKELPDKIEQISHCELSSDQIKLYNHLISQSKEKLLGELQDQSKPIPYLHIFSLLTKLKQVCNHPKSLDPIEYADATSGKWDLFVELLNGSRESGQKVVVFTQYLTMMDLIEEYLKNNQIGFSSIRGATKERGNALKIFHEDPKCEVFVGSLKAVGLGVDLTSASVVIHYDRWWNAARENQATDRVHRMGQQKGVQVFKLVTRGTLEEKIDEIIARKGKLMEDVVSSAQQERLKSFSREELIEILQFVEKDIYESS